MRIGRRTKARSEEHTSELQSPIDTSIDTLSLHDALPIYWGRCGHRNHSSPGDHDGVSIDDGDECGLVAVRRLDRKSTRLNSSHQSTRRLTLFPYTTLFRSIGADADIAIIHPQATMTVSPSTMETNADWSPYEG